MALLGQTPRPELSILHVQLAMTNPMSRLMSIRTGQRNMNGTRTPPSQIVPLSPLNGEVPRMPIISVRHSISISCIFEPNMQNCTV